MTEVLILKRGKKEVTQEEMEKYMEKYMERVIPGYNFSLGLIKGLMGGGESPDLNKILIGSILTGVILANDEKLRVVTKTLPPGTTLDSSTLPGYVG